MRDIAPLIGGVAAFVALALFAVLLRTVGPVLAVVILLVAVFALMWRAGR